jgi:hypothetical protein
MKTALVIAFVALSFLVQTCIIVNMWTELSKQNRALESQINDAVQQISYEVGCRLGDETACDIILRGVIVGD